nr:pupal cuticle protein 36-like [Lepeophtheirus salmonis]
MKSLVVCALVLCSTITIDAGSFFRRTGRNSPPLSSYGVGQVGAASSGGAVSNSGGGSAAGGAGLSNGGSTAAAGSASGPAAPVVAILSETNNAPGTLGDNSDFDNVFEAENGIKQEAVGSTVTIGEESVITMKGSYEYIGPDGQTYVVDWIADENGFQPSAAHLPKDVPIPFPEITEAVEAQIAFAAQEDVAGESSSSVGAGGFGGSGSAGGAGGFDGSGVAGGFGVSVAAGGVGGSVPTGGAGGFGQSFGVSGKNPSVAPLSSYGRK